MRIAKRAFHNRNERSQMGISFDAAIAGLRPGERDAPKKNGAQNDGTREVQTLQDPSRGRHIFRKGYQRRNVFRLGGGVRVGFRAQRAGLLGVVRVVAAAEGLKQGWGFGGMSERSRRGVIPRGCISLARFRDGIGLGERREGCGVVSREELAYSQVEDRNIALWKTCGELGETSGGEGVVVVVVGGEGWGQFGRVRIGRGDRSAEDEAGAARGWRREFGDLEMELSCGRRSGASDLLGWLSMISAGIEQEGYDGESGGDGGEYPPMQPTWGGSLLGYGDGAADAILCGLSEVLLLKRRQVSQKHLAECAGGDVGADSGLSFYGQHRLPVGVKHSERGTRRKRSNLAHEDLLDFIEVRHRRRPHLVTEVVCGRTLLIL